ncbi:MAG: PQQ-binding-like beta-propeller repeat protein, partial [Vicinamibacterales bacterium]
MTWARSARLGALGAAACLLVVLPRVWSADAQSLLPSSYTAAQAAAGQVAYAQNCASCHGQNLDDGAFAPPLSGVEFRQGWFGQSAEPLFARLSTMPPAAPGSLGDERYAQVLAFLLQRNDLAAGETAVPSDADRLRLTLLPGRPGDPSGGLSAGVAVPPPPATRNPFTGFTPVTDAMLASPPSGEWLTWRRGWDSQGFTPLAHITRQNVSGLRMAWSWLLPSGPNEVTPLVHDGVLFVHAYGDRVQALDAVTGDLLWQYTRRLPKEVAPSVKRSIAIYGEMLYVGTSDVHVVALDARTGMVVWDRPVADRKAGYGLTGGPLVAKGKVMVGTTGRAPGGNFIVALDAATGQEAWRFATIARPDAPGGNSWNGVPLEERNGGSAWVAGSYDPAANLALFGVAQTYDTGPYRNAITAPGVTNELLYTDATVALDPDTGRLVWHYQHQPNDQWDLDWAFERVLFTLPGNPKTLVATAGKQAIYDVLEADSGNYAYSIDLGLQNIVIGIDPRTGAKQVNPRLIPGNGEAITVCPHVGGAKSWTPGAFNPTTAVMFAALNESCMDLTPVAPGGRGNLSTGVRWSLRPRPDSDGKYGRVQAVNLATRKVAWIARQRSPYTSGVLATAGGVVFAGSLDRTFAAYDDATGKELWRTRLADVPNSGPIS